MNDRWKPAARDVLSVLPGRAHDLARLQVLGDGGHLPIVTVIGKYNHGKSRLLNELIGQDAFAVADRRETVRLSDIVHQGVRWLDAPGLDADVGTEDDRHAWQAAWLESDIRLFVHAAKEGELDARERALLAELHEDSVRTHRQTLLVLTQVDQLADEAELDKVANAIRAQASHATPHPVSSTRYRAGVEGGKKLMLEKSGIPALHALLDAAVGRIPAARQHETALLYGEIRAELQALLADRQASLDALRRQHQQERDNFAQGLRAVLAKVAGDIDELLKASPVGDAQRPETADQIYALTAAKMERARIQIGYSRACIEIDAYLAGHGVLGLPDAQKTAAGSLNSVMVAVMGVSVKHRDRLQRIFLEAAGVERMQREFAHYYEVSEDRVALAAQVADAEVAVKAIAQALSALRTMEAGT